MASRNGVAAPGFRMPPRVIAIEWDEGTPYHGAVVKCVRMASLETVLRLQEQIPQGGTERAEDFQAAVRYFGDNLIDSWNLLDDDGEPVPVGGEALLAQPADFAFTLVNAFMAQIQTLNPRLPAASNSGDTSRAELIQSPAS